MKNVEKYEISENLASVRLKRIRKQLKLFLEKD